MFLPSSTLAKICNLLRQGKGVNEEHLGEMRNIHRVLLADVCQFVHFVSDDTDVFGPVHHRGWDTYAVLKLFKALFKLEGHISLRLAPKDFSRPIEGGAKRACCKRPLLGLEHVKSINKCICNWVWNILWCDVLRHFRNNRLKRYVATMVANVALHRAIGAERYICHGVKNSNRVFPAVSAPYRCLASAPSFDPKWLVPVYDLMNRFCVRATRARRRNSKHGRQSLFQPWALILGDRGANYEALA